MIRPLDDNPAAKDGGSVGRLPGRGFEPAGRPAPAPPKRNRRRRVRNILISVVVGLLISAAIAPAILRAVVRRQLSAIAAQNLTGELRIGSISFSLPWTIEMGDVTFVAREPDGRSFEMFRVPRASLKFLPSPFDSAPAALPNPTTPHPMSHP